METILMKLIKFLILVILGFLAACGPATSSEIVEPEPQASSPATTQLIALPTEKVTTEAKNSPVATPTGEQEEIAQSSPLATPSPAHPLGEEAENETGKANIPDDAAIVFHRSGGIAGVDEQWTVYRDGRVVANDGRAWQITAEQVEQLLADIEALGFFQLDNDFTPFDTCCDRFTYSLTVHNDDMVKTVTTIDDAANTPDALWNVLERVNSLLVSLQ